MDTNLLPSCKHILLQLPILIDKATMHSFCALNNPFSVLVSEMNYDPVCERREQENAYSQQIYHF